MGAQVGGARDRRWRASLTPRPVSAGVPPPDNRSLPRGRSPLRLGERLPNLGAQPKTMAELGRQSHQVLAELPLLLWHPWPGGDPSLERAEGLGGDRGQARHDARFGNDNRADPTATQELGHSTGHGRPTVIRNRGRQRRFRRARLHGANDVDRESDFVSPAHAGTHPGGEDEARIHGLECGQDD